MANETDTLEEDLDMPDGQFPGPRNRETDKHWKARAADSWLRYSFLWGPLLLAGVFAAIAYPAKVLADLRVEQRSAVDILAAEIRPEILTLQTQVAEGAKVRAELLEITAALLSGKCADTPARERIRQRIAVACEKVGAPSYVP